MRVYIPEQPDDETLQYKFCPHCNYLLEISDDDIHNDEVTCAWCHKNFQISRRSPKPFTFPNSFYCYGQGEKVVHITDEEIQQMINQVATQKDAISIGEFYGISCGDTKVIGEKYEDSYVIIVAKNYWEDSEEI